MASGDTRTEQLLNVLATGTREDIPESGCCNTKTQNYILGAINRMIDLEEEVEWLENNPDVADIVATYATLEAYDTSQLTDNAIIRVLVDETHDNESTYYRWDADSESWEYIGSIGTTSVDIVQETGTSTTSVMSQNAVTTELSTKADSADGFGGESHVELANEIYTTTTQVDSSSFIYRTSAGDVSIESGDAVINYLYGNTTQSGHTDESLTFSYAFADEETTAEINESTFKSYISETTGVYDFTYDGADWLYNSTAVTLSDYGITVTGTPAENDTMQVNYQALVVGTLTTATPTSFVATGFNQYDETNGYAHVVGGNLYRIDATYTSLGFTTTIGGTTTTVTVTNNQFTPEEDGYIYVNGGSGDILIALVWSGTMDSEPYSAYEESTVTIPTADADGTALPTASYGMPSVGDVRDVLDFVSGTYVQNVGHYAYSAANLATVQALGVDYWYDLSHIYYVLETPVTYTLDSSDTGNYTVNDYGTEEIVGTSVPMTVNITYGNSLVDKLRNLLTIQSLGEGLALNGTELYITYGDADNTNY